MRMSKDIKGKLVPKLRFPEFKVSNAWSKKNLGEICDITNGKSNAQDHVEGGKYPLFDRSDVIKASNDFLFDCEAVVIPGEGMKFIPKYYQGKFNLHQRAYALKDFTSSGLFTYYLMLHQSGLLSQKAVQSTVLSLRLPILQNFPILVPEDKDEQQKIADCLSSLDELITAENQKLEALQLHKKGLMQQLFPAEGEKVPKLRFKEFKDSGVWEEIELGQLGELVSGLTYSPEDVRDDGLLVLRSSNIKDSKIVLEDCVFVTSEIKGANFTKPNDILICVRNGSKSLIGKNALVPEGMPLSTHGAFMTVFRASNPEFVFQLFQSDLFKKQVDADLGATINSINGSQLVKYKFTCPKPKEQKRLADFLSSVDELIQSQGVKVEILKAHKKGLMQQLFPDVNEISA